MYLLLLLLIKKYFFSWIGEKSTAQRVFLQQDSFCEIKENFSKILFAANSKQQMKPYRLYPILYLPLFPTPLMAFDCCRTFHTAVWHYLPKKAAGYLLTKKWSCISQYVLEIGIAHYSTTQNRWRDLLSHEHMSTATELLGHKNSRISQLTGWENTQVNFSTSCLTSVFLSISLCMNFLPQY